MLFLIKNSDLILQRPGTADSVLSEPVSPRPHTSNTLVLPRLMSLNFGSDSF